MFEKIEKLLDAGFTKDEIMKMLPKDEPAPEQKPDQKAEPKEPDQKQEEPAKNEKQDKQEEKEPEPFNTQPFTDAIRSMEEAMQAMNAKMQKLALSMYDGPENKKTSVQDIIIKVIDPSGVKKGE